MRADGALGKLRNNRISFAPSSARPPVARRVSVCRANDQDKEGGKKYIGEMDLLDFVTGKSTCIGVMAALSGDSMYPALSAWCTIQASTDHQWWCSVKADAAIWGPAQPAQK